MATQSMDRLTAAEGLMRRRQFGEAIPLFEECLADAPDDLGALLRLGICHLLNRSEDLFLAIYRKAGALLARIERAPDDVRRLWAQYQALAKRVTATAVVLGTIAVAGCASAPGPGAEGAAKPPVTSSHKYSGGVYQEPAKEENKEQPPASPPFSAHRYSGGVYVPPRPEPEGKQ